MICARYRLTEFPSQQKKYKNYKTYQRNTVIKQQSIEMNKHQKLKGYNNFKINPIAKNKKKKAFKNNKE